MLLPVAPSVLEVNEKNQNTTLSLLDESEFTILKLKGLTNYSFKMLLPSSKYHFALYENNNFQTPDYFIEELLKYKSEKSVFDFTVISSKHSLVMINKKVNLEVLNIIYDADGNSDVEIEITLKEYVHRGTKIVTINENNAGVENTRPPTTKPPSREYTIVSGDTLSCIARRFYGDERRYTEIYQANKSLLDDIAYSRGFPRESGHWWIFPGTKIVIP